MIDSSDENESLDDDDSEISKRKKSFKNIKKSRVLNLSPKSIEDEFNFNE